MSHVHQALVVIGLKVYPDNMKKFLFQEATVRSCTHPVDETKKFCAECGKPIFTVTKVARPEYDGDAHVFGFELIKHSSNETMASYIAAYVVESGPYHRATNRVPVEKLVELKANMYATLDETDIWDVGEFGVWVVHYDYYEED